jgi:rhodanese-related sulfurtransferase
MGTPFPNSFFITAADLSAALAGAAPPVVIDVTRRPLVEERGVIIPASRLRDLDAALDEAAAIVPRPVVVTCAHGHNRSQGVVARLRERGIAAQALEHGFDGWTAAGLPTVKREVLGITLGDRLTTWITRRRPKIDRVACPWLIRRFLDDQAQILYVDPDQVLNVANDVGGIAFDLPGAPIEHDGPLCSFDTLINAFGLEDPAVADLAVIVRGADTSRPDLAPQCAGLLAVALGISARHGDDDHAVLREGLVVYDGLYAWLRHAREERHNWPRAA